MGSGPRYEKARICWDASGYGPLEFCTVTHSVTHHRVTVASGESISRRSICGEWLSEVSNKWCRSLPMSRGWSTRLEGWVLSVAHISEVIYRSSDELIESNVWMEVLMGREPQWVCCVESPRAFGWTGSEPA
jgi:hypothetical protein